jgi:WD40 repeat protein
VVKTFHGPTEDIYDVAFSPDNQWLAAASRDRTIRVYDLKEDSLLHLLKGHRDMVMEVAFSPDGDYLLSGSADHSLILWDAISGEQIHAYLDNEEAILDLVFHPDGKSFFSISFVGDLTRWELHPEIFILWKFRDQYQEKLQGDPLFIPRQKGESRQDFQQRQEQAALRKKEIIQDYYLKYIEQREH